MRTLPLRPSIPFDGIVDYLAYRMLRMDAFVWIKGLDPSLATYG